MLETPKLCDYEYKYTLHAGLIFLFKNYSSSNMGADNKKDSKFQTFLDTHQYARKGILLYERIFGTTYVSTGGESTTAKFCSELSAHSLKVGYFCNIILLKMRHCLELYEPSIVYFFRTSNCTKSSTRGVLIKM